MTNHQDTATARSYTVSRDRFVHVDIAAEHLREGDMFITYADGIARFVEVEAVHFEYSDCQVQVITDGGAIRFYDDERVFVTRAREV